VGQLPRGQDRDGRAPALEVVARVPAPPRPAVDDRGGVPALHRALELGVAAADPLVERPRPGVLLHAGLGLPRLLDLPVELERLVACDELGARADDAEPLLDLAAHDLDPRAPVERALEDLAHLGPGARLELDELRVALDPGRLHLGRV